jgi:hypothetical protein
MALPITVPFTFGNATTTQSLSSLDADFSTVYNAVNGIGNGTVSLANVSITGGTVSANITSSSISSGTSNVSITSANGPVSIATNGNNAVYVDTSGSVGIGTTSPASFGSNITTLDIKGTSGSGIKLGTSENFAVYYFSGNGYLATLDSSPIIFDTNNAERIRIGTSGQLGIAGANYGTSGQVLTSNGASAAPSWQNSGSTNGAKAWCSFDGTASSPITPAGSYNVSSITKNGTGDYTINFTSALANANYAWSGSCPPNGAETLGGTVRGYSAATQLAGSCRIRTLGQTTTLYDTTPVSFMCFGN